MRKLFLLSFVFFPVWMFAQGSYYDESKHYQFRSMENGPWQFKPDFYYYSWIKKKIWFVEIKLPGLGIHDRGPAGIGGGDKYVSRYSPNLPLRTATIGIAELEEPEYRKQSESYDSVKNMEALLVADRQLDAVYGTVGDKLNTLKGAFVDNLVTYTANDGDADKALVLWNQYYAVIESVNLIKDAYLDNSKRLKAYQEEVEKMEELVAGSASLIKLQYNKKENGASLSVNTVEDAKKYFGNLKNM